MSRRGSRTGRSSGGKRTAVVKANYVKTGERDAGRRVSASADYYSQDKDIDGSYKGELEAFDRERDDLSKEDTNAFHEENFGDHPYCYRATLSPGTDLGPDEMRDFVRDTMSDLEEIRGHEIDYQAYVHDDHEHPHAHVMFYEDTTLRKSDLNEWREEATTHAQELAQRCDPDLSSGEPTHDHEQTMSDDYSSRFAYEEKPDSESVLDEPNHDIATIHVQELDQAKDYDTSLESGVSDDLNQNLRMLAQDFAKEVGNQALGQIAGSRGAEEDEDEDMDREIERIHRELGEDESTDKPGQATVHMNPDDDLDF